MKTGWKRLPTLLVTLALGACSNAVLVDPAKHDGIVFLSASDERTKDDRFFRHEFEWINGRRTELGVAGAVGVERPETLVGLALSGGGIRSSAFQLGVLSGFHRSGLLDRIDYMSAASGGSWAASAYWVWPDDNALWFFQCLDEQSVMGNGCNAANRWLRSGQPVAISPVGGQRKEQWHDDIKDAYLNGRGDSIALPATSLSSNRPYPIFNATHGLRIWQQQGAEGQLPFQYTAHGLGTIGEPIVKNVGVKGLDADRTYAGDTRGFFLDHSASDFEWRRRKWQRYWKFWDRDSFYEADSNTLGYALASSSGVVNSFFLLQYHFEAVVQQGSDTLSIQGLRTTYTLADAGKSDNTGIMALVERRANIIVASHMGRESRNVDGGNQMANPFEDAALASAQAHHFLGCDVSIPSYADPDNRPWITWGIYSCSNVDQQNRTVIHLKPDPQHVDGFKVFLRELSARHPGSRIGMLLDYLENGQADDPDDRFPRTPTLKTDYDEELPPLYYLLGRYAAEQYGAEALRKALAETIKAS